MSDFTQDPETRRKIDALIRRYVGDEFTDSVESPAAARVAEPRFTQQFMIGVPSIGISHAKSVRY